MNELLKFLKLNLRVKGRPSLKGQHPGRGREFYFIILLFLRQGFSAQPCLSPGTNSLDQAGFKLRDLPASASQVLGLKTCATTAQSEI